MPGPRPKEPKAKPLGLRLTESEHSALVEAAKARGVTMTELCLTAILAIIAMSRDEKPYAIRGEGKNFKRRETLRVHPELGRYERLKGEGLAA